MSNQEKRERILASLRGMSSQDFVFSLAKRGADLRAHRACPSCRGRDLAAEVDQLRRDLAIERECPLHLAASAEVERLRGVILEAFNLGDIGEATNDDKMRRAAIAVLGREVMGEDDDGYAMEDDKNG